jgi:hypothetical protein
MALQGIVDAAIVQINVPIGTLTIPTDQQSSVPTQANNDPPTNG